MVGCEVAKLEWSETRSITSLLDNTLDPIMDTCSVLTVAIMCHGYRGTLIGGDGSEHPVNNILHHLSAIHPKLLPLVSLS